MKAANVSSISGRKPSDNSGILATFSGPKKPLKPLVSRITQPTHSIEDLILISQASASKSGIVTEKNLVEKSKADVKALLSKILHTTEEYLQISKNFESAAIQEFKATQGSPPLEYIH